MTAGSEQRLFADALIELIRGVDSSGRLPGKLARKAVLKLTLVPTSAQMAVLLEPVRYLGAFDDLPANGQKAILDAIRDREEWQLRGCQTGALHQALTRSLFRLRRRVNRARLNGRFNKYSSQLADAAAFGFRRVPGDLMAGLARLRARLNARFAGRPTLSAVLSMTTIDPLLLSICYARPIEQRVRYRGYWHDANSVRTVGIVIGIDFLPTDEGYRYVESNVNFAQRTERSTLYQKDPFIENMLDFAKQSGYQRLIVADSNSDGIEPLTAARYEQGALARDLNLTLIDRENVPESKYARRYDLPELESPNTMLLRTRRFPVALDFIADMKRASLRALQHYQASVGDGELLLPHSGDKPILGQVDADEPFPNVVFKLPEIDQARGVYFLKASSPEHAEAILSAAIQASAAGSLQARLQMRLHGREGIWQAYYKSKIRPDRRLHIVRAHVLIAPIGVRFLSAHKVIAGTPVPASLPMGIIKDASPFMVNYSAGSWYEVVPDEENAAVVRASEAVGRGFAWAFEYGFRVN